MRCERRPTTLGKRPGIWPRTEFAAILIRTPDSSTPAHSLMLSLNGAAHAVYAAAVRAAAADRSLASIDWTTATPRPLASYRRLIVIGAGKAALAMAGALERALADLVPKERAPGGVVVVPHGYRTMVPPSVTRPTRIEVLEAGHPVPDQAGIEATRRTLALATSAGEDDLVVALISGGGSSLWPAVADSISLADVRTTFSLLLASGADIAEMNTVRKHLVGLGGGRLAAAAFPADVLALVVSDVPGDDPSVIASGPTVPDPTTFADAITIVRRRGLWGHLPLAVRSHLEQGARAPELETVKPGARCFERTRTLLVGSNHQALAGAREEAVRLGFEPHLVTDQLSGEAREAGRAVARQAAACAPDRPACLLWGGETTVHVRGRGKGGRNQELALAAALELERLAGPGATPSGLELAILSAGTDGIDGPTDAAGACVGPDTTAVARALGTDPRARLDDNDAYTALDAAGALLRLGPTHTNVMDIVIALARPRARTTPREHRRHP